MKAETTNNKLQEYKQKDNIARSETELCSLLWLKFNIIIFGTLKFACRTFIFWKRSYNQNIQLRLDYKPK